jgi:hypothetical protein
VGTPNTLASESTCALQRAESDALVFGAASRERAASNCARVARGGVGENRGRAHHRGLLRMRERNLDDFDAEVGVVRIPRVVVAARELFARANSRCAGDVDVDVGLVVRVVHDGVRVRSAAGLHVRDVPGMIDVGDIEDAQAADAILADDFLRRVLAAIEPGRGRFGRDEEQVLPDRHVAL